MDKLYKNKTRGWSSHVNKQESSEVEKLMVWKVQSKQVYYSAFHSVQFDSHATFIDYSLLQTWDPRTNLYEIFG